MNRAYIAIAPEFLREILGLPDGTEILAVEGRPQMVRLLVQHPDLPEDDGEPSTAAPTFAAVYDGAPRPRHDFTGWGVRS